MIRTLVTVALLAVTLMAAKPQPVECWLEWEQPNLRFTAINLKDDWYGLYLGTLNLRPDENGTLTALVNGGLDEVTLWRRGGGGALYKPGKQLNDYHPICIAQAPPIE